MRDSAASDLHCAPASDLDVQDDSHDDDGVYDYIVRGCGWQATYRAQVSGVNQFEVKQKLAIPRRGRATDPAPSAPAHHQ